MKLLQAYKFELMPNGEQTRLMRQYAGCCRMVYNKALAWQNEQYQINNSLKFSYTTIANLLPQWKSELPWLRNAPRQRCSCCGHIAKENRQSQAKFACVRCGYKTDADLNATRNILAAGHAVLACGEMVQKDLSVKHEPAEGITPVLA